MPTTRGFSLPEVVIALGVLALLLAAAAPSFRGLLLEARMTTAVNELVHTAHLAHQAAQAHDRDIVVCRSTDGEQCAPPGNWAAGWMVFVNRDRDDPPVADPGEPVLHASSAH
ncbi:MAG: GspH/FimT family pseudopilin, partial [Gammaproteobacteria bacterium]|nr:GspH/FimT family pseudopilin [Gammaproteobacteria bacterium]